MPFARCTLANALGLPVCDLYVLRDIVNNDILRDIVNNDVLRDIVNNDTFGIPVALKIALQVAVHWDYHQL